MRRIFSTFAVIVGLALGAGSALAQSPPARIFPEPDERGEVVIQSFSYKGVTANAPIGPDLHIKNEGGSDGAGLCVTASNVMNGAFLAVMDMIRLKASELWIYVKGRPGGSYPTKFTRDVNAVYGGDATVTNYEGKDASVLEEWSAKGWPIGVTMGTGRNYNYQPISHMVCLLYFERGGLACVLDNNFPGVVSWMPADEFERRWKMPGGNGWAVVWDVPEPAPDSAPDPDPLDLPVPIEAAAILLLACLAAIAPLVVLLALASQRGAVADDDLALAA